MCLQSPCAIWVDQSLVDSLHLGIRLSKIQFSSPSLYPPCALLSPCARLADPAGVSHDPEISPIPNHIYAFAIQFSNVFGELTRCNDMDDLNLKQLMPLQIAPQAKDYLARICIPHLIL